MKYSEKLMLEVGKKYNKSTLFRMRQFYEMFSYIKWNPLGSKLSWSHYRELLVVKNINAIEYYIDICEKNNKFVMEYCSDKGLFLKSMN